jgi:hypothetical protein
VVQAVTAEAAMQAQFTLGPGMDRMGPGAAMGVPGIRQARGAIAAVIPAMIARG